MSFEIDWYLNFFNISWAREQDKLVLLVIFEDKKMATNVAQEIESWSEKFTRFEDKSTLLQIIYAEDFLDIKTHEEVSKLVPLRKCRIISEKDLKKQEFYYEKIASLTNKSDEDSKK